MSSRTWLACMAAIAGLLTFALPARANPMWAVIQDGNATMFEYFPTGPSATSTGAYALKIGHLGVNPANFLGSQFLADGSMWAVIQDGDATMFEYFPTGPSATSTGAYALQIGHLGVDPDNFLGFQFLDDGSMWAAIQDGDATMFEYFPTGPSATSTGAYALQIGHLGVDADNFLGFQFLADGSMWAAIQDGDATMFEYFPTGPSATSTGAYALQIGHLGVDPDNFLGFQFLADGSMWAAIQDGDATMFEYFPTGPSATSTGAYALQIGHLGVDPDNFLGFQFLAGPAGPGGAVPEPSTWALLIAGFGLAGATLRARHTAVASAWRRPH